MSNNGRRCEPPSTTLAGQPLSAQVAGARGTVYGSEGWGFESLRARHRLPRSQRWLLSTWIIVHSIWPDQLVPRRCRGRLPVRRCGDIAVPQGIAYCAVLVIELSTIASQS